MKLLYVDETAPFDWAKAAAAFRALAVKAEEFRLSLVKMGEASHECAETWRRARRAFRYSKRAVKAFRAFNGRLPRGWRKHIRRRKAEERRARG